MTHLTHHSIARKTLRRPQLDIAKLRQLRDSLSSSLGRRNAVHKSGWQTVTPEKQRVCKTKAPSDFSLQGVNIDRRNSWAIAANVGYSLRLAASCSLAKFCAAKYIDMSRGFNKVIQSSCWPLEISKSRKVTGFVSWTETLAPSTHAGPSESEPRRRTRMEVLGSFGHKGAIWNGNCRNSILSEKKSFMVQDGTSASC